MTNNDKTFNMHEKKKRWSTIKVISVSFITLALLATGCLFLFVHSLFQTPDVTRLPSWHPFKSAQARQQYLARYQMREKQWPVAYENRLVKTGYGTTFVRISGPLNAPCLVLLPSANASSLVWIPDIKILSEHFRIYAIDNIYDVGLSVYTRPMKNSNDFTAWLDEVFSQLNLGNKVNLMGYSYGGWLTSQYALSHPERLHKIVLLAPAATLYQLPSEWAWRGIISALPWKHFMKKYMVNWLFEDLAKKTDKNSRDIINNMLEDAVMSLKCYKMKMLVPPTVLTDDELRGLKPPALFLVGEHEKIYPATNAVKRIQSIAPRIQTEIIMNASHDLPISQAKQVCQKVIDFLK